MRAFLVMASLCSLAAACATTGEPASTGGGSSVEYVLLRHEGGGSGRRAPIEVVATRTVRGRDGVVRVEPIHRGQPLPPNGVLASSVAVHPGHGRASGRGVEASRERVPGTGAAVPGGAEDIVLPYPVTRVFRGFGACRGDRHHHEAIDIGGVGPDSGLGTPIVAMARARVTLIGRPEDDPGEFGSPDTRGGETERGGKLLPRSGKVDGYGHVTYFTKDKGRWRSGVVIVMRGVGGTLDDHEIRYMHLSAVRPGLAVGDVVEPGDEVGLMGGTAVQEASPHLHLDIEAPDGHRLDVAPLLGLPPTARTCPEVDDDGREARVWSRAVSLPACGVWEGEEDFVSGRYYAHDVEVNVAKGATLEVVLHRNGGAWKPKLEVLDAEGQTLYEGAGATRVGKRAPLKLTRKLTGKSGDQAKLVLKAKEDLALKLRVTAWPTARAGLLLPQDGAYGLTLTTTGCDG